MWELLQKIEKLWWKPYWKSIAELSETEKNVRLITSRSSWLWQFVCENGMVKKSENIFENYWKDKYEYRIVQSALCDEDKLEDFILSNVKIDEK